MSTEIEALNPEYRSFIESIFRSAPFIEHIGYRLIDVGPGWCESALKLKDWHLQQDGFVHAGIMSTMADHTSGAASGTVLPDGKRPLTIEFRINLLRPGVGERLLCRADVIRAGRTTVVVEAEVRAVKAGEEKMVAKMLATMAVV